MVAPDRIPPPAPPQGAGPPPDPRSQLVEALRMIANTAEQAGLVFEELLMEAIGGPGSPPPTAGPPIGGPPTLGPPGQPPLPGV